MMKKLIYLALPFLLLVAGCATTSKGPAFASLPDAKSQVAEYYENGRNLIIKGKFKNIDEIRKTVLIEEKRIGFSDLYSIERF